MDRWPATSAVECGHSTGGQGPAADVPLIVASGCLPFVATLLPAFGTDMRTGRGWILRFVLGGSGGFTLSDTSVDAVFGPAERLIKAEAKVGNKTVDKPWISVRPAGDGRQLVAFKGTLDLGACLRLRLVLYDGLDGGCRTMFVDLSKAGVVDASAVRMLVRVNERLCQQGGCLRVVGVSGSARAAIEQGGGGEILGTEESAHPVST